VINFVVTLLLSDQA